LRQRFDQRQGFLVSAIVHLLLLTVLAAHPPSPGALPPADVARVEEARQRVFLPPPEVLRQLAPRRPRPREAPARPAPTPALPQAKDRISVGAPSQLRAQGPMILNRDDDLTQVAKGRPDVAPSPAPKPVPPATAQAQPRGTGDGAERAGGLRLPPGLLGGAAAPEGGRLGPAGPSIASSLRNLDQRLESYGTPGLDSGTGKQMGPLYFDPMGADFTRWINHFKNEVYRNWIVPQAAMMGFGGHVDLEFTVDREGRMATPRLLRSSGTSSLDRAAQNALLGSRLMPLPPDYGPPTVTMRVTFFYNEAPQGS
jgi:protein TonB